MVESTIVPLFQKQASLPQQLYYLCKQLLLLNTIVYRRIFRKLTQCIPVRHLITGLYPAEI